MARVEVSSGGAEAVASHTYTRCTPCWVMSSSNLRNVSSGRATMRNGPLSAPLHSSVQGLYLHYPWSLSISEDDIKVP